MDFDRLQALQAKWESAIQDKEKAESRESTARLSAQDQLETLFNCQIDFHFRDQRDPWGGRFGHTRIMWPTIRNEWQAVSTELDELFDKSQSNWSIRPFSGRVIGLGFDGRNGAYLDVLPAGHKWVARLFVADAEQIAVRNAITVIGDVA